MFARILICFIALLPCLVWAQSSLPPCPASGLKHNCYGSNSNSSLVAYVGEFQNGKPNGFGVFTWPGGKYVGQWSDDKYHGLGIRYDSEGSVLAQGRWANSLLAESFVLDKKIYPFNASPQINSSLQKSSLPQCSNIYTSNNSSWHDCYGVATYPDSSKYIGEWAQGRRKGNGSFIWPGGMRLTGIWLADRPLVGIEYNPNGTINRSGSWQGDMPNP